MNSRESEKAAEEARAEVTQPNRDARYSEAALRYLQRIGYAEAKRRKAVRPSTEQPDHDEAG